MEFVEGETLESLIKRSGRLEVKLTLEILSQVTAGLAAVHKQKLVHRDIKPSNIMVSLEEGNAVTVKIIDRFPLVRANLRLPATFPHSSSILTIHFNYQRSTTTRTTTKDEDDLKPEMR
jgi:serine/threonine protein kinase